MSDLGWLYERFSANRDNRFMVFRGHRYTYEWLLEKIGLWKERLENEAIKQGTSVSIEGDYSPEVVALLLALIERDCIIVPLTDSVAVHKAEFRQIAEVHVSVTFSNDDNWKIQRLANTPAQPVNPIARPLVDGKKPGLVLFSSGSTGKSKAALHDFSLLLEKFKRPRHTFVSLTFLLLDHIGGINTMLYVLSNTGTVVTVEDRNPDTVLGAVEQEKAELLPASPTFLNLILISEAYKRHDLSSLKRITYGTEVMPALTLARLCEILPGVDFQQTYGLSELGILRSKSREQNSLWVKVGGEGFETRIVDGTLHIRAQSAMLGYLNAPSPFDSEGWFNTGDAVEVDGEWLKILGRQSEMINVGGMKVFPAEVENVLMEMPNVQDVSVIGEKNPITGQIVVARFNLFEPEEHEQLRKRMKEFCRSKLAQFKIPTKLKIVDEAQYSLRFKKMRKNELV
jgi:acyl-CoA synthetase (AMP-forming)/AMP-acid ligase II